ncbi:TPA: hypothetical protein ACLK0A_001311 [Klebsiella pneumoniae]
MISKILSRFKKDPERASYDEWVKRFSAQVFECTRSEDAVKAELECWPFVPENSIYNWRDAYPVEAANEALSYYGD